MIVFLSQINFLTYYLKLLKIVYKFKLYSKAFETNYSFLFHKINEYNFIKFIISLIEIQKYH